MAEMLARSHFVTEGRMKRYLQILRGCDLVRIGTTKQGTVLTRKGEEFLDYLAGSGRETFSSPPRPEGHRKPAS